MNKRVQELMIEAGFHMRPRMEGIEDGIDWSCSSYGYDHVVQKFAELIVEECIKSALSLQDIAIKAQWETEETFHMIVDTIAEDLNMLHIFRD
jgi:hypothetical protein